MMNMFQFPLKGHRHVRSDRIQVSPQIVGKLNDCLLGKRGILFTKVINGIQGVIDEMRLDLGKNDMIAVLFKQDGLFLETLRLSAVHKEMENEQGNGDAEMLGIAVEVEVPHNHAYCRYCKINQKIPPGMSAKFIPVTDDCHYCEQNDKPSGKLTEVINNRRNIIIEYIGDDDPGNGCEQTQHRYPFPAYLNEFSFRGQCSGDIFIEQKFDAVKRNDDKQIKQTVYKH